jgi:DNA-binding NarL/FixJ family response regulator
VRFPPSKSARPHFENTPGTNGGRTIQSECEIIGAIEDGRTELEAATIHPPDIRLLDVSLPRLNGFAVEEKLDGLKSAAKVILVTARRDRNESSAL